MQRIRPYIDREGIDSWGACTFQRGLPLFEVRSKSRIPGNAESLLVFLFGYYTEEYTQRNVSRYAIADDYHHVLLPKLRRLAAALEEAFPGEAFQPWIDSSPIHEVRAAYAAGLGCIGMNGQLLSPRYGSYCFIGEIVTTMRLDIPDSAAPSLCTQCGECVRACPTGALSAEGFRVELCRSHITQKKGELTEWEREQVRAGGMAWGCDLCTDACPVNRNAEKSKVKEFYKERVPQLTAGRIQELCETKAYGWRGKKVLERNLEIITKDTGNP